MRVDQQHSSPSISHISCPRRVVTRDRERSRRNKTHNGQRSRVPPYWKREFNSIPLQVLCKRTTVQCVQQQQGTCVCGWVGVLINGRTSIYLISSCATNSFSFLFIIQQAKMLLPFYDPGKNPWTSSLLLLLLLLPWDDKLMYVHGCVWIGNDHPRKIHKSIVHERGRPWSRMRTTWWCWPRTHTVGG